MTLKIDHLNEDISVSIRYISVSIRYILQPID